MTYAIRPLGCVCAPLFAFLLTIAGCGDDASTDTETTGDSSTTHASSGGETTSGTTSNPMGSSGAGSTSSGDSSTSGSADTGSAPSGSESGDSNSSSTGTPIGAFEDARTYEAFWPKSREECEMMQMQGVNCYYMVSFCPDGSTASVWTDIVGTGTYTLNGTSIEAQWDDVRISPVEFEYDAETDTLQDNVFSETWERNTEFLLVDCE